jgi:hypothetical protein
VLDHAVAPALEALQFEAVLQNHAEQNVIATSLTHSMYQSSMDGPRLG